MVKYEKALYKFMGFKKGSYPRKYNALLENKETGRKVKVSFGDRRYEQYRDSTGLGIYSDKDHLDKNRRRQYRARHSQEKKTFRNYWSPGYFSWYFMW